MLLYDYENAITSFSGEHRFLSNFWPVAVCYEGVLYPSTEHAYQAHKTTDVNARKEISELPTAGKAKRAGNKVDIRSDWPDVRIGIMTDLQRLKYQDPELKSLLLTTGERTLIEGNTWGDVFWGMVYDSGNSCWEGLNQLGEILMEIRDEIKEEQYYV